PSTSKIATSPSAARAASTRATSSVGTGSRRRIVRVGVLTIRRACCNVSRVPTSASRLLVVANRAPVEATPGGEEYGFRRTVGGLATALDVTLRERPGLWVAWAGTAGDEVLTPDRTAPPYPLPTAHLSEREVDNYSGGFANQVLWPLCHIFPTRCVFEPAYWSAYQRLKQRFASPGRR